MRSSQLMDVHNSTGVINAFSVPLATADGHALCRVPPSKRKARPAVAWVAQPGAVVELSPKLDPYPTRPPLTASVLEERNRPATVSVTSYAETTFRCRPVQSRAVDTHMCRPAALGEAI
ncbi:hypothetical protein EVAR_41013_1 [Eumeta japonica]|uniref:Uncharacterized protein n=1 Tax=Eumeta variegata TaxID=151549 RepID=A0A4C1Z322_EUMVA|nr:hypothetical protein EVAR_41013_1 [Eumeta japonica]